MIKIYLASPYSHPDVKIRGERFIAKKMGKPVVYLQGMKDD